MDGMLFTTIILAIATVVLAVFTIMLWYETKKSREFQKEIYTPELSITFFPSQRYINDLFISIKNIGKVPIYNIKLKKVIGDDIDTLMEKKLSETTFLNEINYLRPQQEIKNLIKQIWGKDEDFSKFTLIYSFEDKFKKVYNKKFKFDFNQFKDMLGASDDVKSDVVKVLKDMKKSIDKLNKK